MRFISSSFPLLCLAGMLAVQACAAEPSLEELLAKARSIADYDAVIARFPRSAEAHDRRGSEHFKQGNIAASIADFDRAIALEPAREPGHWKRGISYYYAAEFEKGQQQFEGYQTVDDNDVENAVWRFLCMARRLGVGPARKAMLKIGADPRVPMMQVYDLYRGELQPDDVLAAARNGDPSPPELNQRLFYAHLYLGLYYDATGNREQALRHVTSAEEHKIGHYMWDVARVHAERLREAAK
ncbi:MAG: tetratricopeptide repeat protein [Planctomycetes bacterium]|nr:tetratricopeptide repeat protein [Planctomycetota bacterium]